MGKREKQFAHRYTKRPAVELFDVLEDPYCQKNLAGESRLANQRKILTQALEEWMLSQNDQGRSTELAAEQRQAEWKQVQYRQRDREKARSKAE